MIQLEEILKKLLNGFTIRLKVQPMKLNFSNTAAVIAAATGGGGGKAKDPLDNPHH